MSSQNSQPKKYCKCSNCDSMREHFCMVECRYLPVQNSLCEGCQKESRCKLKKKGRIKQVPDEKTFDIYKMTLHQRVSLGSGVDVIRVPGGWIYNMTTPKGQFDDERTSCYVPEPLLRKTK